MGIFPIQSHVWPRHVTNSYAGITRIRFLGMISAHVLRHPVFEICYKSSIINLIFKGVKRILPSDFIIGLNDVFAIGIYGKNDY